MLILFNYFSLKYSWFTMFQVYRKMSQLYWLGQKVHSGFSIPSMEKPKWNFWPTQHIWILKGSLVAIIRAVHLEAGGLIQGWSGWQLFTCWGRQWAGWQPDSTLWGSYRRATVSSFTGRPKYSLKKAVTSLQLGLLTGKRGSIMHPFQSVFKGESKWKQQLGESPAHFRERDFHFLYSLRKRNPKHLKSESDKPFFFCKWEILWAGRRHRRIKGNWAGKFH